MARRRIHQYVTGTAALVALVYGSAVEAQRGATDGQWRVYHADNGATRYSTLDQITPENFTDLQIAWRWKSDNFGPRPEFKNETVPLMIDGILYFTAGSERDVIAADAGTGQTLWHWRLDEGERGRKAPRRNSGRGVAYWTDDRGDARIFVVTPGFHLAGLDARTGRPAAGFGTDGVVDLMDRWEGLVDPVGNLGNTSPPTVVGDVVIVGPALAAGGTPPSKENTPGHVTAYSARSGERLWTFHTVPKTGELGYDTWESGSAEYSGNAGVWPPFSADDELGYVYLPLDAPTSDYYGGHRLGDNLFSSSLVVVEAATGRLVWHRQQVHHDIWDYDNPTAPILIDITVAGQPIQAVVQLTKQSFAYTYDRRTGEPVWPIEERPVPASDIPGERTSPTQPFPTRPAPYDLQGVSEDDLIDFTPELRREALEIMKDYRFGPLYTPASRLGDPVGPKGTIQAPGAAGGSLWEAAAFDPETGMLFIPSSTIPRALAMTDETGESNVRYISGPPRVPEPQGLPLLKPPYGRITAIDMNIGEHVWMIPNGDTPDAIRSHPTLRDLDLPPTGKASRAGVLVTKTLLVVGEGWGGDATLRAIDKVSGTTLATIELPAPQTGLPMTYLHNGRQFIVFTVGNVRDNHPAELVALALPTRRD